MSYKLKLKIASMSYTTKIVTLFKIFPKQTPYFMELVRSIEFEKKGVNFKYAFVGVYFVEMYVEGLGSLRKYWEEDEFDDTLIYRFTFNPGDEYGHGEKSPPFDKESSDLFCDRCLPFMISKGKTGIPLIIHDFPEYARYALEYLP